MIPDTETTLLRGGKMYEEGNEKSVKPGFGGDNTDGLRRQCRKQKRQGGTDGDKAPAAVEKTEANEEGTEKPYDGVTITMMMNQGTYATTFSGVFLEIVRKSKKKQALPWIFSR